MTSNKVKCPACGALLTTHGSKSFNHCGGRWSIIDNLVGGKSTSVDVEKELEKEEVDIPDEIDINKPTLPVREKARVVKPKDELICPFCNGDVYGTDRKGVYYCDRCRRYLTDD